MVVVPRVARFSEESLLHRGSSAAAAPRVARFSEESPLHRASSEAVVPRAVRFSEESPIQRINSVGSRHSKNSAEQYWGKPPKPPVSLIAIHFRGEITPMLQSAKEAGKPKHYVCLRDLRAEPYCLKATANTPSANIYLTNHATDQVEASFGFGIDSASYY